MARKILVLILLILVWGVQIAHGQKMEFGVNVDGGFPMAEFRENVNRNGIGLDAFFTVRVSDSPNSLGVNLGFINYGHVSRLERFNSNIPEVNVRVVTTNNIGTLHLLNRFEKPGGAVRPYIDGLIGMNYLYTESRVENTYSDEPLAETINFEDTSLSYGMGAGLKFKIADHVEAETGQRAAWFIDLRGRYLSGGKAEYLKEGSLQRVNGQLVYDPIYSRTDLFTIHLGFTVKLY